MRPWTCLRRLFLLIALDAILVSGLLAPRACRAQSSEPGKSTTQSQSDSADKPNQNDAQAADGTTRLRIIVTNALDKPVGNASVYVRFNQTGGFLRKDKLAELSFKTNEDGTVKTPALPQGKILIQVIAKGWHTFGKWYEIEKDQDTIAIKLEAAPHWY